MPAQLTLQLRGPSETSGPATLLVTANKVIE
jgi:hypothetical protein